MISKEYLEKHLPPHADADRTRSLILRMWITCWIVGFLVFLCKYFACRSDLFYYVDAQKLLIDGAVMPEFPKVIKGMCMVQVWSVLFALGYSLQFYAGFFVESQSIYLVRRLPDGGKTLRHMVLDVPVRWALCALMTALVSVFAAFLIWRFCTPAICLPL